MAAIDETLREDFRDQVFAETYADEFLNSYVATQIKVLREQRDMTQAELAALVGTTQTAVSRFENINYSSRNVRTLVKLARAFGVTLRVSFETYGTLIDDFINFGRKSLQRVPREMDPAIYPDVSQAASGTDSTGEEMAPQDDETGEPTREDRSNSLQHVEIHMAKAKLDQSEIRIDTRVAQ